MNASEHARLLYYSGRRQRNAETGIILSVIVFHLSFFLPLDRDRRVR